MRASFVVKRGEENATKNKGRVDFSMRTWYNTRKIIPRTRQAMERQPNAEQAHVIETLDENLILFASAGTGKTFTVANRVSHILQTHRAEPNEILCLTFTTKACEEMREDVGSYVGRAAKGVEIRTIHGFCYLLMREENRRRGDKYLDATVCDETDAEELIRSILSSQYAYWQEGAISKPEEGEAQDVEFAIFQKKTSLRDFVSALKHARESQKIYTQNEEEDYQRAYDYLRSAEPATYASILSISDKQGGQVRDHEFESAMNRYAGRLAFAYDDYLKKSNRVDYDDLIIFASRYLDEQETFARWATRYKYIIVDEMQDTSMLEYSVLKRIFGKNNVMMCGDFFQSIYEWRGSRPEYVLDDFIQNFQAKIYMFSENYRSTRTLTAATFGYLRATYPQFVGKYCPKDITVRSADEGEKILLLGFDNRKEEGYRIYRYLKKNVAEGNTSLCVMARSNFYLSSLLRTFEECNLEYPEEERLRFFTAEENLQFYRKPVVKDVLAVLKLLFNKADRVSMERISQRYVRLIGIKAIEQIRLQNRVGASIVSFLDRQVYEHEDPYHVLIESFHDGEIVVYDTETTGLDLNTDQMVQIAAVRMDREGNITDVFERMIEPTVPIGQGAYETHGFDLAYIRKHGGVSAKEALRDFSEFVRGALLVGHNSARFDSPLIRRQLQDNGLPPLEIRGEYDTLSIAKEFHAELPDFRLSTLCFKYDIVNEAAHNAYGDIVATAKVLYQLITQDILPTALERQAICAKYKDKFEKLYAFFEELREKCKTASAADTLTFLIDKMMMKSKYKSDGDHRALDWLVSAFYGEKGSAEVVLQDFVTNAELSATRADGLFVGKNALPLLTVHQAKGCEFDVVILAGADDRNFPNFFAKNERTEEEEKRVFYVAISRAKKKLVLTRSLYNGRTELAPSPFVKNIPEEYLWSNEGWHRVSDE